VSLVGHHGLEPRIANGVGDRCRIGRDHDPADISFARPQGNLDDHGAPGDIGQRLARQPRRGHARRDQDDRPAGGSRGLVDTLSGSHEMSCRGSKKCQKVSAQPAQTVLQRWCKRHRFRAISSRGRAFEQALREGA
jgi:hypothetical protein